MDHETNAEDTNGYIYFSPSEKRVNQASSIFTYVNLSMGSFITRKISEVLAE